MRHTTNNIGMPKHRKAGHTPKNFTGKRGGKSIKRKGTTRKLRRLRRGTHVNKYER